ncbi:MAG: hypothetical protein QQN44_01805 [Nitrosopumilus sp.]
MIPEEFDAEIRKLLDEIRNVIKEQLKHIENQQVDPEMRAMMAAVFKLTVDNKWNALFDLIQKHHKAIKRQKEKEKDSIVNEDNVEQIIRELEQRGKVERL